MDAEDLDDALGHHVEARRGGLVVEGVEVEGGQALVVVVVILILVVVVVVEVRRVPAAAGSARGDDHGQARAAIVRGRERGLVLGVFARVGCGGAAAAASSRRPSPSRRHRFLSSLFFDFSFLSKKRQFQQLFRECFSNHKHKKRGGSNERADAAREEGKRLDLFFFRL